MSTDETTFGMMPWEAAGEIQCLRIERDALLKEVARLNAERDGIISDRDNAARVHQTNFRRINILREALEKVEKSRCEDCSEIASTALIEDLLIEQRLQ